MNGLYTRIRYAAAFRRLHPQELWCGFDRRFGVVVGLQQLNGAYAIPANRGQQVKWIAASKAVARANSSPYRFAIGQEIVEIVANPLSSDGQLVQSRASVSMFGQLSGPIRRSP